MNEQEGEIDRLSCLASIQEANERILYVHMQRQEQKNLLFTKAPIRLQRKEA